MLDSGKAAIVSVEGVCLQPVIVQRVEGNVFQVYASTVIQGE